MRPFFGHDGRGLLAQDVGTREQIGALQPDAWGDSPSAPVVDPLRAAIGLAVPQKLRNFRGPSEIVDELAVCGVHGCRLNTMFIAASTPRFQQVVYMGKNLPMDAKPPHPTVTRLLDAAKRATAGQPAQVNDYQDLLVWLDISAATLTNWKSRGVSKNGAIAAEGQFGCSVAHILDGVEEVDVRTPRPLLNEPKKVLAWLATQMESQSPSRRKTIGNLLSRMAEEPEDDDLQDQIALFLTSGTPEKRTGTLG